MSGDNYIKELIKNVDIELDKSGWQLLNTDRLTINSGYQPELYFYLVLEEKQANNYQNTDRHLR